MRYIKNIESNSSNFYFGSPEDAEAAFYSAFEMGDVDLMNAVLAEQGVSCIHPGSSPIVGRELVLESWLRILKQFSDAAFYTEVLNRSMVDNVAVHLVAERIAADHQIDTPTSLVLATNVYIREKNGWRMLMHHASLTATDDYMQQKDEPEITHEAPHTLQ